MEAYYYEYTLLKMGKHIPMVPFLYWINVIEIYYCMIDLFKDQNIPIVFLMYYNSADYIRYTYFLKLHNSINGKSYFMIQLT